MKTGILTHMAVVIPVVVWPSDIDFSLVAWLLLDVNHTKKTRNVIID